MQACFLLKTYGFICTEPHILSLQRFLKIFDMHQKTEFSVQVCLSFLRNSDRRTNAITVLKDYLESLKSVSSLLWGNTCMIFIFYFFTFLQRVFASRQLINPSCVILCHCVEPVLLAELSMRVMGQR